MRLLCKLEGRYFEWSTIVDAPVTYPMTLEELRAYIKEEFGLQGLDLLEKRLERIEANGTSSLLGTTLEDALLGNRAGKGETRLSLDQFKAWCRGELDLKDAEGVPR